MNFLRNTWYMAGWASELAPGQLLARRLLDEPVVMFRDAAGLPQALHDRCPHRFVPLSAGRVQRERGTVQCGYHGLEFDGSGRCVLNPHGEGAVPAAAKVRAYPLVERYSALWIWMGDAARADAALIPDFQCMDPETSYVGKSYLRPRAHYQLETDNILDLSHLEYVHADSIGSEAIKHSRIEMRQEGQTVWSLRFIQNEQLKEGLCDQLGVPHGLRTDRWLDVRWDAPACMLLTGRRALTGQPRSEPLGPDIVAPHIFTPETAGTSHYFTAVCMPKSAGPQAQGMAERLVKSFTQVFDHEDTPMLELQQACIGEQDFWSLQPVLLPSDAPGVRVRRLLDGMIRDEQAQLKQQ